MYSDYASKIILLAIGEKEEFPQVQIDKLVNNKKILLSDKFMVMNLSSLKKWIERFRVYNSPIKLNKFSEKPMGNSEDFKKWAKLYLDGAETLHEIKNRNPHYWIACFYLLSHSLELALKAYLTLENVKGHKLKLLAKKFNKKSNSKITDEEMLKISELVKLNKGQGGLRYDNKIQDNFFPSTFQTISSLIKRLLSLGEKILK